MVQAVERRLGRRLFDDVPDGLHRVAQGCGQVTVGFVDPLERLQPSVDSRRQE